MREQVKQINPQIPEDYHWHTISVEELEYFICLGDKIFDALRDKRLDPIKDKMDFGDYYVREYPEIRQGKNKYLDSVFNDFCASFGD